ncbi:MAG TPA: 50S ribosomal protein L23 [Candidatus Saccharimonadales bacterium]|nr:50S ribosomal protein L23 [Candidatus Saccharimonadales bacterium]
MMDARQIVRLALVTEKGSVQREKHNQYLFDVHPKANKIEIKKAVEAIFPVQVECVRTMNYQGKKKRVGAFSGRRSSWKKAVVTLKEGQTIELFESV